jgi:zinc protease
VIRLFQNPALLVCVVLAALPLMAADSDFHIPFERYTLPNGMRVVLSRDNTVPVVAVYIVYDVGARSEEKGRTGFAHLFEHMMFEGSANVKKGDHFKYVQSNGGTLNGSTHPDYTDFFETLPSNKLALALWLESDRMRSLSITEENLKNQQEAVKEEKRLSFDNRAYSTAITEAWPALIFSNFQSSHSLIGSFDDLNAATVDDVSKFFRTYYAPNNAVLTIAGDFQTDEAKKIVSEYFADIPPQPRPPRPDMTEPERADGKSQAVEDTHARVPGLVIGWQAPKRHSQDWYAAGMIDAVLTGGKSSRIELDLVKGAQSVLQVESGLGFPFQSFTDYRDPGEYAAFVLYKPTFAPDQVADQIQKEVDRIADKGVDDAELARVKALIRYGKISGLQTSLGRAQLLGQYELLDGKPEMIDQDFTNLLAVTSAQMQAVAKKYLTSRLRDVLFIQPVRQKPATAQPAPKKGEVK